MPTSILWADASELSLEQYERIKEKMLLSNHELIKMLQLITGYDEDTAEELLYEYLGMMHDYLTGDSKLNLLYDSFQELLNELFDFNVTFIIDTSCLIGFVEVDK